MKAIKILTVILLLSPGRSLSEKGEEVQKRLEVLSFLRKKH